MIDHLELKTAKLSDCTDFYLKVLEPLGYALKLEGEIRGFGAEGLDFFLVEGEPSANVHFAFAASSRGAVDAAYEAGRAAGFTLDREPEIAPHIHPDYYAGYLRDPDGRLVEIVCQRPL